MRPLTPLNRNFLRASTLLTGFAVGCGMLGRNSLAIAAAGFAFLLALTALRNLNRNGDR